MEIIDSLKKYPDYISNEYRKIHSLEDNEGSKDSLIDESISFAPLCVIDVFKKRDKSRLYLVAQKYCDILSTNNSDIKFKFNKESGMIVFCNIRENEPYTVKLLAIDAIYIFNKISEQVQLNNTSLSQDDLNQLKIQSIVECFNTLYAEPIKSKKYDVSKTARRLGYLENKDVKFSYISGIRVQKFRSLKDRYLPLGRYITVITGKNDTMKSSILGLLAHPFSSPTNAKDLYGHELKTDMRDVFRLSLNKDASEYIYYIEAVTNFREELSEPVRLYAQPQENRHRITVGAGNTLGEGNFYLNTSMINLS